jgi:hypothetical protein
MTMNALRLSWIASLFLLPIPALADEAAPEELNALHATGLLQVWGTVFDQDEDPLADPAGFGDPEHDPGISVQRARLGLSGVRGDTQRSLNGNIEFGIGAPFDAPTPDAGFGVIEANLGANFALGEQQLRISAGLQKLPFSRDLLFSARDQLFQERTVASQWMSPVRDAGAIVDFESKFGVRARAGVFNGSGQLYGDDNSGKTLVGRLEFAKGDTYRTWSPAGSPAIGVAVAALNDQGIATSTTTLNADLLVRVANVNLYAEGTRSVETPREGAGAAPAVLDPTVSLGASAQLSYFIPAGKAETSGIEPGVRFSYFDSATWSEDNGDVGLLQAGATWRHIVPGFDVGAGYVHRMEFGGRNLANDTARIWVQFADKRPIPLR